MKPMLAGQVDLAKVKFPCMASPKLDGIRALIIDGVVMSRKMLPIPNAHVQALFGRPEFNGLDGELIVGPAYAEDAYRKTMSGVMSRDGEPDVAFHVFDDFSQREYGYEYRYSRLRERLSKMSFCHMGTGLQAVHHVFLQDMKNLELYEQDMLAIGYEGIMLRSIDGPYKEGRSTANEGWLLKVKRFADSEAEIIGYKERLHNANEATVDELGHTKRSSHKENKHGRGDLGAFTVRDVKSGEEFDVGTGFDDRQRAELWESRDACIGRVIVYKYFPMGNLAAPRFPVFKGFRAKEDM